MTEFAIAGAGLFLGCVLSPVMTVIAAPCLVLCLLLVSIQVPFSFLGLLCAVVALCAIPLTWLLISCLFERVGLRDLFEDHMCYRWLPCVVMMFLLPELLSEDVLHGIVEIYMRHRAEVLLSVFSYFTSMVLKWGILVGCAYVLVYALLAFIVYLVSIPLIVRRNRVELSFSITYQIAVVPLVLLLLAISCQSISQYFLHELLLPG
ncbi:hypothetical protein EBR25_01905 [bacterium]|nr:hypothetical protein [bacterium]